MPLTLTFVPQLAIAFVTRCRLVCFVFCSCSFHSAIFFFLILLILYFPFFTKLLPIRSLLALFFPLPPHCRRTAAVLPPALASIVFRYHSTPRRATSRLITYIISKLTTEKKELPRQKILPFLEHPYFTRSCLFFASSSFPHPLYFLPLPGLPLSTALLSICWLVCLSL